jgi:hypothetical protein
MAPKIFSILTIIIAGVAIYLGFEGEKRVLELQRVGLKTHGILEDTKRELKRTKGEYDKVEALLTKTEAELAETKAKLRDTEEKLAATEAKLATVTAERDAQKAALEEMQAKIAEALGIPKGENLDPAQAIAAIKEQIATMTSKVKEQEAKIVDLEKIKAENETVIAGLTADKVRNEADIEKKKKVIAKHEQGIMQKGIKGRVMAVNPGWGFCVISTGDKQGAANGRVMIVARDGKAIGKVKITNVEATQSIADIQANTFVRGMFVQPGDEVIYTGDDKVKFEEEKPVAAVTAPAAQLPLPQ